MKHSLKYLILLFSSFHFNFNFSQTLHLPPRASNALTGSQFVVTINSGSLSLSSRENLIFSEISNGNVPDFYRTLIPVTSTAVIGGITQSAVYFVIPDYLAVGCDTDYFLCPMSPMLASEIGALAGCTLPTRKMVNDIWTAATVHLTPSPIPPSPSMTTVPVFDQHNTTVKGQRAGFIAQHPLGELVSGDKKDVIISNQIYSIANRVIIYGWLQTNGTPIQPLTNVHADTYMDYSHGIRLVQDSCMLNGTTPSSVKSILKSASLNPILSDEGPISQPWYPYNQPVTQLSKPVSFAVLQNTSSSLKIKAANDLDVSDYKVYTSADGLTFNPPITLPKTNLIVNGLSTNTICYIKIAAYNTAYNITSSMSEVLAAVPSAVNDSVLIVNGFDRAVTGNTYNFIRQHGSSFYNNQHYYESATNEAVTDGLVNLSDYKTVDYILGKESSADETFSNAEQTFVSDYLKQGGHLFVSGSEIAWDLDHLGSAADKAFFNNYLKAAYTFDAPNNSASSFYTAYNSGMSSSIFNGIDSVNFDNGSSGTYNVDYPDVINTLNGSNADLHYASNSNDISAIHYRGVFTGGSQEGRLVYLCFPFETIYNQAKRDSLMNRIIYFFDNQQLTTGVASIENSDDFGLAVFPNPINSNGTIDLNFNKQEAVSIDLYDIQGNKVFSKTNQPFDAGRRFISFNGYDLASGIYLLSVKTKNAEKNIRIAIIN